MREIFPRVQPQEQSSVLPSSSYSCWVVSGVGISSFSDPGLRSNQAPHHYTGIHMGTLAYARTISGPVIRYTSQGATIDLGIMEEWWNESGDQEPETGEGKEGRTHHQSAVNLQNNRKTNSSTQIILGLISPLVITFSLLMLFPPCLFWCSDDEGGLTLASLLFCHSMFIFIGFASDSSKYSIAYMVSIIPSWILAFGLWLSF